MTPARLVSELAAAIKKACALVKLPLESEELVEVEVFTQYLPEDLFETTRYLPFCLIEFLELTDDLKDGSTVHIGLTVGTYAPETDAWLDAFHLAEVIRQEVLTWRVIAKRFRLKSARWQTPDTQPREFFYLAAELIYDVFQPQENFREVW